MALGPPNGRKQGDSNRNIPAGANMDSLHPIYNSNNSNDRPVTRRSTLDNVALPSLSNTSGMYHQPQQSYPQSVMQSNMYNSFDNTLQQGLPNQYAAASNSASQNNTTKGRLRVSKACDRCRSQKIKCSGDNPCTSCVKHGKECIFSQLQPNTQAQGVKKQKLDNQAFETYGLPVVTRKSDKAYTEFLENRVQYLENLLTEESSTVFKNFDICRSENMHVESPIYAASSKWRFSRRHTNTLLNEWCEKVYNELSEDSKKSIVLPRTEYFGWNLSGTNYLPRDRLPEVPDFKLTYDTSVYIDYFFKEINPLYAIIHETVFREQLIAYNELVMEEKQILKENNGSLGSHDSKTNQTRLFTAMLLLVYALSIRFIEFQKPEGPKLEQLKVEERLFKYSKQVISVLSFEWESFELIQCWLLMTLYLRISHRQTSAYHALGQAITMTKSMGLGQKFHKASTASTYEQLKATRIFWSVFSMDKVLGLQFGREAGLASADMTIGYPSLAFDTESERDDWITAPSFAMIHIARIANFLHSNAAVDLPLVKYQQINSIFNELEAWLSSHGFSDNELFNDDSNSEVSSLVRAQVKLHLYDTVNSIHGRIFLNLVGRKVHNNGIRFPMVIGACEGIVNVLERANEANLLFVPWYSSLLLLMNVGVYSVNLISADLYRREGKLLFARAVALVEKFNSAPVKNDKGDTTGNRFTMAKEALWALKMMNHMLKLRLQEDLDDIGQIGLEPTPAGMNKQHFNQYGIEGEENKANVPSIFDETFSSSKPPSVTNRAIDTPVSVNFNGDQVDDPNLIANLQWFNSWLDFNYEI